MQGERDPFAVIRRRLLRFSQLEATVQLTIDLPDPLGNKLRQEAALRGVEPGRCGAEMIQETLSAAERAHSLRALFEKWDREDATDDPNELARRTAEWEAFKRAMNTNRGSERKFWPQLSPSGED